jgi:hypothetical protein
MYMQIQTQELSRAWKVHGHGERQRRQRHKKKYKDMARDKGDKDFQQDLRRRTRLKRRAFRTKINQGEERKDELLGKRDRDIPMNDPITLVILV